MRENPFLLNLSNARLIPKKDFGDLLEQVQNKFIHVFTPLALFSAAAYLTGSKKCIQYFPKATEEGLILSGILGGIAVAGNRIYEDQLKKKTFKTTPLPSWKPSNLCCPYPSYCKYVK